MTVSDIASMLRKLLLVVNSKAGSCEAQQKTQGLVAALSQLKGYSWQIMDVSDFTLSSVEDDLYAIVILGGDGTVHHVINKLHNWQIKIVIIPCGTYNHLAKDLNIPDDISSCVAMITAGKSMAIDLAEVNGHYFVNNSAIGLYPRAVKKRRHYLRWPKWVGMLLASLELLRKFPVFKVKYTLEGKSFELLTPLVFIANNVYELDLLNLTHRNSLTLGQLSLYINHAATRFDFLKLLLTMLVHKRKKVPGYFHILQVSSCEIDLTKKQVDIAMDGEIVSLNTPLCYRIHPGQLQLLLPLNPS